MAGPRFCLAGQLLQPGLELREGEAHQFMDGGWATVWTLSGAEIACLPPASRSGRLGEALAGMIAFVRRLRPARAADRH